ncbi:hypothetical protein [Staphylococcus aureus]|nr:hypothetical protein [Staphylococcus aureus]
MRRENILLRLIPFNDYDNKNFKMFIVIKNTKVIILKNKIFVLVKSRLLCKMLYNVFTISTYQN